MHSCRWQQVQTFLNSTTRSFRSWLKERACWKRLHCSTSSTANVLHCALHDPTRGQRMRRVQTGVPPGVKLFEKHANPLLPLGCLGTIVCEPFALHHRRRFGSFSKHKTSIDGYCLLLLLKWRKGKSTTSGQNFYAVSYIGLHSWMRKKAGTLSGRPSAPPSEPENICGGSLSRNIIKMRNHLRFLQKRILTGWRCSLLMLSHKWKIL